MNRKNIIIISLLALIMIVSFTSNAVHFTNNGNLYVIKTDDTDVSLNGKTITDLVSKHPINTIQLLQVDDQNVPIYTVKMGNDLSIIEARKKIDEIFSNKSISKQNLSWLEELETIIENTKLTDDSLYAKAIKKKKLVEQMKSLIMDWKTMNVYQINSVKNILDNIQKPIKTLPISTDQLDLIQTKLDIIIKETQVILNSGYPFGEGINAPDESKMNWLKEYGASWEKNSDSHKIMLDAITNKLTYNQVISEFQEKVSKSNIESSKQKWTNKIEKLQKANDRFNNKVKKLTEKEVGLSIKCKYEINKIEQNNLQQKYAETLNELLAAKKYSSDLNDILSDINTMKLEFEKQNELLSAYTIEVSKHNMYQGGFIDNNTSVPKMVSNLSAIGSIYGKSNSSVWLTALNKTLMGTDLTKSMFQKLNLFLSSDPGLPQFNQLCPTQLISEIIKWKCSKLTDEDEQHKYIMRLAFQEAGAIEEINADMINLNLIMSKYEGAIMHQWNQHVSSFNTKKPFNLPLLIKAQLANKNRRSQMNNEINVIMETLEKSESYARVLWNNAYKQGITVFQLMKDQSTSMINANYQVASILLPQKKKQSDKQDTGSGGCNCLSLSSKKYEKIANNSTIQQKMPPKSKNALNDIPAPEFWKSLTYDSRALKYLEIGLGLGSKIGELGVAVAQKDAKPFIKAIKEIASKSLQHLLLQTSDIELQNNTHYESSYFNSLIDTLLQEEAQVKIKAKWKKFGDAIVNDIVPDIDDIVNLGTPAKIIDDIKTFAKDPNALLQFGEKNRLLSKDNMQYAIFGGRTEYDDTNIIPGESIFCEKNGRKMLLVNAFKDNEFQLLLFVGNNIPNQILWSKKREWEHGTLMIGKHGYMIMRRAGFPNAIIWKNTVDQNLYDGDMSISGVDNSALIAVLYQAVDGSVLFTAFTDNFVALTQIVSGNTRQIYTGLLDGIPYVVTQADTTLTLYNCMNGTALELDPLDSSILNVSINNSTVNVATSTGILQYDYKGDLLYGVNDKTSRVMEITKNIYIVVSKSHENYFTTINNPRFLKDVQLEPKDYYIWKNNMLYIRSQGNISVYDYELESLYNLEYSTANTPSNAAVTTGVYYEGYFYTVDGSNLFIFGKNNKLIIKTTLPYTMPSDVNGLTYEGNIYFGKSIQGTTGANGSKNTIGDYLLIEVNGTNISINTPNVTQTADLSTGNIYKIGTGCQQFADSNGNHLYLLTDSAGKTSAFLSTPNGKINIPLLSGIDVSNMVCTVKNGIYKINNGQYYLATSGDYVLCMSKNSPKVTLYGTSLTSVKTFTPIINASKMYVQGILPVPGRGFLYWYDNSIWSVVTTGTGETVTYLVVAIPAYGQNISNISYNDKIVSFNFVDGAGNDAVGEVIWSMPVVQGDSSAIGSLMYSLNASTAEAIMSMPIKTNVMNGKIKEVASVSCVPTVTLNTDEGKVYQIQLKYRNSVIVVQEFNSATIPNLMILNKKNLRGSASDDVQLNITNVNGSDSIQLIFKLVNDVIEITDSKVTTSTVQKYIYGTSSFLKLFPEMNTSKGLDIAIKTIQNPQRAVPTMMYGLGYIMYQITVDSAMSYIPTQIKNIAIEQLSSLVFVYKSYAKAKKYQYKFKQAQNIYSTVNAKTLLMLNDIEKGISESFTILGNILVFANQNSSELTVSCDTLKSVVDSTSKEKPDVKMQNGCHFINGKYPVTWNNWCVLFQASNNNLISYIYDNGTLTSVTNKNFAPIRIMNIINGKLYTTTANGKFQVVQLPLTSTSTPKLIGNYDALLTNPKIVKENDGSVSLYSGSVSVLNTISNENIFYNNGKTGFTINTSDSDLSIGSVLGTESSVDLEFLLTSKNYLFVINNETGIQGKILLTDVIKGNSFQLGDMTSSELIIKVPGAGGNNKSYKMIIGVDSNIYEFNFKPGTNATVSDIKNSIVLMNFNNEFSKNNKTYPYLFNTQNGIEFKGLTLTKYAKLPIILVTCNSYVYLCMDGSSYKIGKKNSSLVINSNSTFKVNKLTKPVSINDNIGDGFSNVWESTITWGNATIKLVTNSDFSCIATSVGATENGKFSYGADSTKYKITVLTKAPGDYVTNYTVNTIEQVPSISDFYLFGDSIFVLNKDNVYTLYQYCIYPFSNKSLKSWTSDLKLPKFNPSGYISNFTDNKNKSAIMLVNYKSSSFFDTDVNKTITLTYKESSGDDITVGWLYALKNGQLVLKSKSGALGYSTTFSSFGNNVVRLLGPAEYNSNLSLSISNKTGYNLITVKNTTGKSSGSASITQTENWLALNGDTTLLRINKGIQLIQLTKEKQQLINICSPTGLNGASKGIYALTLADDNTLNCSFVTAEAKNISYNDATILNIDLIEYYLIDTENVSNIKTEQNITAVPTISPKISVHYQLTGCTPATAFFPISQTNYNSYAYSTISFLGLNSINIMPGTPTYLGTFTMGDPCIIIGGNICTLYEESTLNKIFEPTINISAPTSDLSGSERYTVTVDSSNIYPILVQNDDKLCITATKDSLNSIYYIGNTLVKDKIQYSGQNTTNSSFATDLLISNDKLFVATISGKVYSYNLPNLSNEQEVANLPTTSTTPIKLTPSALGAVASNGTRSEYIIDTNISNSHDIISNTSSIGAQLFPASEGTFKPTQEKNIGNIIRFYQTGGDIWAFIGTKCRLKIVKNGSIDDTGEISLNNATANGVLSVNNGNIKVPYYIYQNNVFIYVPYFKSLLRIYSNSKGNMFILPIFNGFKLGSNGKAITDKMTYYLDENACTKIGLNVQSLPEISLYVTINNKQYISHSDPNIETSWSYNPDVLNNWDSPEKNILTEYGAVSNKHWDVKHTPSGMLSLYRKSEIYYFFCRWPNIYDVDTSSGYKNGGSKFITSVTHFFTENVFDVMESTILIKTSYSHDRKMDYKLTYDKNNNIKKNHQWLKYMPILDKNITTPNGGSGGQW